MGSDRYTFGDSAAAAARLELLAEVFGPTTARFLRGLRRPGRRRVVDLGCGPGFTTALIADTLGAERIVGIEASPAFAREAAARLGPRAQVLAADVRELPDATRDADLLFARFLLTHLADPVEAIAHWLTRTSATGVVAAEEVESITTADPVLGRYLDLQRAMLEAHGQRLDVGPVLARAASAPWTLVDSDVVRLSPPAAVAARMFALNLASWRTRPAVAELAGARELDAIAAGLDALAADPEGGRKTITWELRHLVVAARGRP